MSVMHFHSISTHITSTQQTKREETKYSQKTFHYSSVLKYNSFHLKTQNSLEFHCKLSVYYFEHYKCLNAIINPLSEMRQVRDKHLGNEVFAIVVRCISTWPIRTKTDKPELIGKRYNSRIHFLWKTSSKV